MRRNHVDIVSFEAKTTDVIDFDRWKYQHRNWFTRKMWDLLMKWGCLVNPTDTKTTFQKVTVDTNSVAHAVMDCIEGIYVRGFRPKQVYMGPEEFEKHIYGDFDYHQSANFHIKLSHGYSMFDIPVEVVPHMKGILVV